MAHSSSAANLTVNKLFNFTDHVVLVTGGATGLGEMAAQAFVQNGARVIIASRKKTELEKKLTNAYGEAVSSIVCCAPRPTANSLPRLPKRLGMTRLFSETKATKKRASSLCTLSSSSSAFEYLPLAISHAQICASLHIRCTAFR